MEYNMSQTIAILKELGYERVLDPYDPTAVTYEQPLGSMFKSRVFVFETGICVHTLGGNQVLKVKTYNQYPAGIRSTLLLQIRHYASLYAGVVAPEAPDWTIKNRGGLL